MNRLIIDIFFGIKTIEMHLILSEYNQSAIIRAMNFIILCFLGVSQIFAAPQDIAVQSSWYSSQSGLYALPHQDYGVPEVPAAEYGVAPEAIPPIVSQTTEQ
jgi:hypothetical protein